MNASAWSVALSGVDGYAVEVEAAKGGGLPRTVVVGLPDKALNEAKERVRAAARACEQEWPPQLVTINLSPAHLPKAGTHFDLAIAAAAIAAESDQAHPKLPSTVLVGELSLDGRVRRVRGVLPAMLAAVKAGFNEAIVPSGQQAEASLVPGLEVRGAGTLTEAMELLRGKQVPAPQPAAPASAPETPEDGFEPDLADVMGHADGKFALEVAAAGRHHMFLHGPPGVGKTMLASRLPSILPDLDSAEAVEVSSIHSLAGHHLTRLITRPPYADPHHSMTAVALIGGGASGELRPGAISLAHRGVLFLDECPDFGTKLDALRTPLENGWVSVNRARQSTTFPARFQLVMAANPCPCGRHGVAGMTCSCDPIKVRRYQERISAPILDRIDIRHHMTSVNRVLLDVASGPGERSAVVLERVLEARDRQRRRLRDTPWTTNGEVSGTYLRQHLSLPDVSPLNTALQRGTISARGVDKVIRIAWTLADLAGHEQFGAEELHAAMQLRQGEMKGHAA